MRKTIFEYSILMIAVLLIHLAMSDIRPQETANNIHLVGHWNFDDGSGQDLSGNENQVIFGDARLHQMGNNGYCLQIQTKNKKPPQILVNSKKPAILQGTFSLWINHCWGPNVAQLLKYNNNAINLRLYRRYIQARFKGQSNFDFGSSVLDSTWVNYLTREDAFYPHQRALAKEGEWHHFVVTYDYENGQIIGYRDGELIAVADISNGGAEPLKQSDLEKIILAQDYSGFIDDIQIYDTVLKAQEIQKLYQSVAGNYKNRQDIVENEVKTAYYRYQDEDKILYDAWLQYYPIKQKDLKIVFNNIVVDGKDSTILTAKNELEKAVKEILGLRLSSQLRLSNQGNLVLGTPQSSKLVATIEAELGLSRIKYDGYVLKSIVYAGQPCLFIAANDPAGIVFGVFDLIRRIQFGENIQKLNIVENPHTQIRMVNHWDFFRGFKGDEWNGIQPDPYNWEGERENSVFNWENVRTGNTKLMKDWARLLASAGWNAICPTEINWDFRNNYLEHLDEVEKMASIFRNYGIKLYWTPNYLLALNQTTAESIYKRVPDFGGYLLKLGSEAQLGNPFPKMVNQIADNLLPFGGNVLLRGFVYGKNRYAHLTEVYRNTMPYDILIPNDGKYRNNVIIIGKASPLDWDFAAPISPLDGAFRKTAYGTEMVISKDWPVSWVEKWHWWMNYDNKRDGPHHFNKNYIKCLLGVSMISPSPAWTSCPLNMVNYYGIGRLAWNPSLSVDQIYDQWVTLTFNSNATVKGKMKEILLLSDDVTKNLFIYRGYGGVWIDTGEENLVQQKTPHTVNKKGIGIVSIEAQQKVLKQYSPALRTLYGDSLKSEEYLPYFHFAPFEKKLTHGKTVIQDIYSKLDNAVDGAKKMLEIWKTLKDLIDRKRYKYMEDQLSHFVDKAVLDREKMIKAFEKVSGRKYIDQNRRY